MYAFDSFEWDERKRIKVFLERALDIAVDGPVILNDIKALTGTSPKEGEKRFKTTLKISIVLTSCH